MANRMPAIFVGHGSPLSAIEDNEYTRTWERLGKQIGKPQAILSISAHWFTEGTRIQTSASPKQIYDMYGFPQALYDLEYRPSGDPALAARAEQLLGGTVSEDDSWGIDHGSWAVLCKMYPAADVPVVQLSVNASATPEECYRIGQALSPLRDEGIMVLASGDVVHNLRRVDWDMDRGYPWADSFDEYIRGRIEAGDHAAVVGYGSRGEEAALSVPTPDHFFPLLYALGASRLDDSVEAFNDSRTLGSISMTGYLFN